MRPNPDTWEGRMAIRAAERNKIAGQRAYEEQQAEFDKQFAERKHELERQHDNPIEKPSDCDKCWEWELNWHPLSDRNAYHWAHVVPDWWPRFETQYALMCDHDCHDAGDDFTFVVGGRPILIA